VIQLKETFVKTAPIRDKRLRLNQQKLDRLKNLLGAHSESEALEQAIDLLLAEEDIKRTLRKVKGKARIERVFT
jgi:hypothetical protein